MPSFPSMGIGSPSWKSNHTKGKKTMSKLATLKMFEKMDADEHFKTAKKIASDNMASPNYTCSTLLEDEHDHSIKSYIIDLLIKENESTFWSCKLAIIEKEQKQKKLINANQILLEKMYDYDQVDPKDLVSELKADIELADRDITNYFYRIKAVRKLLKKLIRKKKK